MTKTLTAPSVLYVFGVVPADADPPPGTMLVAHGGLAAVTSEVPLAEFEESALRANLNDRGWLEEKARAHEEVLQSFSGVQPVLPLRFGTIYRDVDDIRLLLAGRAEFFAAALERLRGHVELGVKAWFDPARFARPRATEGRSYLERRRDELSFARRAGAAAAEAHDRLAAVAVAGVMNRPQPRELTGRSERMLLNCAYLVPVSDERLTDELARLEAEMAPLGLVFELTGPWPPYNFAPHEDDG